MTFASKIVSSSSALEKSLDDYLEYLNQYPQTVGLLGDASKGEIEIIKNKQKISEIEKTTNRKVGIMGKDNYWIWFNDAVQFPNKKYGVYGRLIWVSSLTGVPGVAVMAVFPDGKVALNRNFRHATRSWEYELPRGARNPNETIEAAAEREVKEETGMIIQNLHLLGNMAPDSGTVNSVVPIFLAKIIAKEESQPEDSEAIASVDKFSIAEIKQGFIDGYLSQKINGKVQRIPLRDPFLAYAVLLADIKNIVKN